MEKLEIAFLKITEQDLETIMNWRMQPDITQYMNTDPKLTISGQKKWYKGILEKKNERYWIISVDGVKVGVASLVEPETVSRKIHTGVYIAKKEKRSLRLILDVQWNLYRYAFEVLNCNKVCEEIFSINKGVHRILDICGSKKEGELRQHVYKNGVYYDVMIRGILHSEWDEMKDKLQYNKARIEEYEYVTAK